MKVYSETFAKAGRWCAVDKVLYPGKKTSSNCEVKDRQTSSQASLLVRSLEGSGFDDVGPIVVFVDA